MATHVAGVPVEVTESSFPQLVAGPQPVLLTSGPSGAARAGGWSRNSNRGRGVVRRVGGGQLNVDANRPGAVVGFRAPALLLIKVWATAGLVDRVSPPTICWPGCGRNSPEAEPDPRTATPGLAAGRGCF